MGQKQTQPHVWMMSALPAIADMCGAQADVRFVPIADSAPQQQSYSICAITHAACSNSGRRCVVSENVILSFGRLVTGEAVFVQCLVAGFSVLKVSEPPAARRGVLF